MDTKMDTSSMNSNYHQISYSPYSQMVNNSSQSPYSLVQPPQMFTSYQPTHQKPPANTNPVPIDYSPYNNYLYQSSIPSDTYSSYYTTGKPSPTPNHMTSSVSNGYMASYTTGKSTPVHSATNESNASSSNNVQSYYAYQTSQQQQPKMTTSDMVYESYKSKTNKNSPIPSTRNSDHQQQQSTTTNNTNKPETTVTLRNKNPKTPVVTMRHSKNGQTLEELQQKHKTMYYEPAVADILKPQPQQNGAEQPTTGQSTATREKRFSLMDDYNFMNQLNQLHESIEKRKNTAAYRVETIREDQSLAVQPRDV